MSNTVKLNTCPKCSAPIPLAAPQGLCPKCVLLGAATATEAGVPATATSEIPSLERIAKAFPQLEVLELIGRGGMGFVFKARQPHLDRFVALKLLPDKLAKDALFAERFNREGRVLARLSHPNIVSVFDFGQTGGFYYLTMEYVDGVNLRQAMRAGRFSPAEALALVPKVCEALQYAHEQGILHRDIKPENILLDAKGRVKIADFGIAKLVGEDQTNITLTNTGAALGTPHYMAPEQVEKPATVDHRADIYSLGVVFYEMLTGELPIGRFAAPSSKTPVNASVDDVVFRTLEKDRELRFQSAGEMKTEVEHLGAGASTPPSVEVEQPLPAPAWMKRLGILFCVLGGVAFLPTLLSLGSTVRVYHSGMLLAITGVALLTRDRWWSGVAIVVNVIGLVMPLVSMITGKVMSHHGTLPPGWSLGIPGVPNSAGMGVVLSLAQAGAFAIGLWALLRPSAKACFLAKPYVPMYRAYTWWIFIGVLVVGMGAVLVTRRHRASVAEAAAVAKENATKAEPMIQFTFTSVELREEAGARWLAMDYVEQVRGDCQHTFRYDANVPGFTAQTRMDSRLSDAKAGFVPVLHQRVLWKLPESLPQPDALALRDLVAKEWIGKSAAIEPGDERLLFEAEVLGGGTLATSMGVMLKPADASSNARKEAAPPPKHAASAELWAPKLTPGEKPNLSEILQEAKGLAQEGRYEEALQRQIWYHNHALETDPAQTGVRLSFALSYWAELAQRYPKGKEALVEIRDRGTREFASGSGHFALFQEVSSINEQLGQADATYELFRSIQSRDPKLAQRCYPIAEDLLVEKGEYALCASFIPDFQERFEEIRIMQEFEIVDRTPAGNQTKKRQYAQRAFVKDTRKLVEILVGVGRKAEAEQIRDQAVAVLNIPELQSAVADAEKNVERAATTK